MTLQCLEEIASRKKDHFAMEIILFCKSDNFHMIYIPLRKIPKFHLISWCGNFTERHSFGSFGRPTRKLGGISVFYAVFPTIFGHKENNYSGEVNSDCLQGEQKTSSQKREQCCFLDQPFPYWKI